MSQPSPRILYCHCQYAQVVPKETKEAVLRQLSQSGLPFDAVADLCEMSARRDPLLASLAGGGPLKIAACFPRAVKWLFHQASAPLSLDSTEVVNLRTLPAEEASLALIASTLEANLPAGKVTIADHPSPPSPHQ